MESFYVRNDLSAYLYPYIVFTRMLGEGYRRRFRSLLLSPFVVRVMSRERY